MVEMSIKQKSLEFLLNQTLSYLQKDPKKNFQKIINNLNKISKLLPLPLFKKQVSAVKNLADKDRPGIHLLYNLLKDTKPEIINKLAHNFLINAVWMGIPRQRDFSAKHKVNVPWFLLIDPTERCNYHCKGCWAGEYGRIDMPAELFDRIIIEAKEMGIYYIVVSGGEPTLWKPLIPMMKKHSDVAFMMYTNGSMIAQKSYAKEIAQAGNLVPCFSVEGFKEKTDERRGKGAWERVMKAMDNMKELGVPFGYSITQTNSNIEEVMSDEFVDFMVQKGAKIAWYFQYIPIGRTPDLSMMLSPEQRMYSYKRIHEIRATKPLFAADFWNDGPYTGGCLAGGRRYFHITADGGIEPCAFIHLSQGNIKDMSLEDALRLPFFQEIQKLQPYSDNLLSPCLLVDHPDLFRKIGHLSGVKSTNGTLENLGKEVGKHLDKLSKEWEKISRPVFEHDFPEVAKKTREYKKRKEDFLKKNKGNIEQFYVSENKKK